jgi:hypothetical protein
LQVRLLNSRPLDREELPLCEFVENIPFYVARTMLIKFFAISLFSVSLSALTPSSSIAQRLSVSECRTLFPYGDYRGSCKQTMKGQSMRGKPTRCDKYIPPVFTDKAALERKAWYKARGCDENGNKFK